MARILLRDLRDVDWSSALRFLTHEEVPKEVEARAVAAIRSDTERWEREEAEKAREWRRLTKPSRDLLREGRRGGIPDDRLAEAKKVVGRAVEQSPGFDPFELTVEPEEPSLVIGSMEATIVPPYDFTWTYQNASGPVHVTTQARKSDGFVFCDVKCPQGGNDSNGVARSALGIFFQPVVDGKVRFSATPSLIFFWYTHCILADARSRGAVGLQVYRFKFDGTLDPSPNNGPFDVHDYFASVDSEQWYNTSCQEGTHSGSLSPPMTIEFAVSKNRFYNLWVYARTNADADGGDFFYDSAARAEMNGIVPKMTWKFVT
jgi:hypothetical protein